MNNDIVGIFPSFGQGITGGIEASAEAAWEAVQRIAPDKKSTPFLLCYGRTPNNVDDFANASFAGSKGSAIRSAFTTLAKPRVVLVWHLGLLKLLPPLLKYQPRIILFLHGIEAWRKQDPATRFLFRFVDIFLTNSAYTWKRFLQYQPQLSSKKHVVLPLGLGTSVRSPQVEPDDTPKMLMVSRLSAYEDYKGHRELISAWHEVRRHISNAQLVIAGDGDLRPTLEHTITKKDLSHSVKTLGYISEEVKQKLLVESRCLAMPSRNEGFGLVYLEAMRVGRPCLVSTEDAGREVVNPPEAGLAVDVRNNAMLVEATCRLLTKGPEWDNWCRSAKQRYDQFFTKDRFQSRLCSILEMWW